MLGSMVLTTEQVNAQFFDKLKKKAESALTQKVEEKAKDSIDSTSEKAEEAAQPELGEPSEDLIAFTTCSDIKIENVVVGELGNYTYKKGFSNEELQAFVNRKPNEAKQGCILPSLNSREVMYLEVDSKAFAKTSSSWEMQCVKSDNPSAGAIDEGRDQYPANVNYLSDKHMMLHCGHDQENVEKCATGKMSDLAAAHDADLKKRGKTSFSFLATVGWNSPNNGEKLYCQYYNADSGQSLFAFEYLRVKGS